MTIDEYLDSIGINPKGLPFTDEYIKWLEERHREMLKDDIEFVIDLGNRYPSIYTDGPTCPYVRRIMDHCESATGQKWETIKEALDG